MRCGYTSHWPAGENIYFDTPKGDLVRLEVVQDIQFLCENINMCHPVKPTGMNYDEGPCGGPRQAPSCVNEGEGDEKVDAEKVDGTPVSEAEEGGAYDETVGSGLWVEHETDPDSKGMLGDHKL